MKNNKRTIYFRKQRAMGIGMVLIAVLSALIFEGDASAAILIAPIGLYTIFTKRMVLTNDYYFEEQERREKESH